MSKRRALIIANTKHEDPNLSQLTAPGKDAATFAKVLREKNVCGFDDVKVLKNKPESTVRRAIEDLFADKKPNDLLLLYFSGHGVRDDGGTLYLAVKNTDRLRLRSTAIKSDFIRDAMEHTSAKRVVLILDCCNSGAFAKGTKADRGASIGTQAAFETGYGRIILTASDAIQFAWEGDQVIGDKTQNSLFTHFLVEGLRGAADHDGDGRITVDELYEYAFREVKLSTSKQTPSKFATKQEGTLIPRQNIPIQDVKPAPLPDDLTAAIQSSLSFVREGAVRELRELLSGRHLGLAHTARIVLKKIAEEDDSRNVSRLATEALGSISQMGEKAVEKQKAGSTRNVRPKVKEELKRKQVKRKVKPISKALPKVRTKPVSRKSTVQRKDRRLGTKRKGIRQRGTPLTRPKESKTQVAKKQSSPQEIPAFFDSELSKYLSGQGLLETAPIQIIMKLVANSAWNSYTDVLKLNNVAIPISYYGSSFDTEKEVLTGRMYIGSHEITISWGGIKSGQASKQFSVQSGKPVTIIVENQAVGDTAYRLRNYVWEISIRD